MQFRRSEYLLFTFERLPPSLTAPGAGDTHLLLTALHSGQHLLLSPDEVEALRRVPSDAWVDGHDLELLGFLASRIELLVSLGVLLSNSEDRFCKLYLEREELLASSHWPPFAAAYHLINQARESEIANSGRVLDTAAQEQNAEERGQAFLALHGSPPPEFPEKKNFVEERELPREIISTPVTQALLRRRTCRYFDGEGSLPLGQLAHLLRLTFGAWASRTIAGRVRLLMKTSPSGGSLHPIEAYPLILRCQGLKSGIYHYDVAEHVLELIGEMSEDKARELARYWAQGQIFAGACSVLIILVARFDRNFWKYRERENSYSVVLEDAGHLSQTFQILATDLDLGSFYTGAINGEALVEHLGLRYPAEAPLGLLGVGIKAAEKGSEPDPEVFSFSPPPGGPHGR